MAEIYASNLGFDYKVIYKRIKSHLHFYVIVGEIINKIIGHICENNNWHSREVESKDGYILETAEPCWVDLNKINL